MPGPDTLRPGDSQADVDNKYERYFDSLENHLRKTQDLLKGTPLPAGETIDSNYTLFLDLNNKILDFYRYYPNTSERLMRVWDIIDKLYQKCKESESGKELVSGRNTFERYLKSFGFPKDLISKSDPETLKKMHSFVLTKSLEQTVSKVDLTVMTVPSLRNLTYQDSVKGGTVKMLDVIGSASKDIDDKSEQKLRKGMQDELEKHYNIIDIIFSLGNELKSAHGPLRKQQILSEVKNIYKSNDMRAMLDPDYFLGIYAALPPLLDEHGNEEKVSLGDAFFQSYKEIKRAGKHWVKDPKSGWIRPERTTTGPLPKFARNRALFIEDDPHNTISIGIEKITKELMDASVAPEQEAGEYQGKKPNAIRRLVGLASKADFSAFDRLKNVPAEEFEDRAKHPVSIQGQTGAYLAYHWALILMDLDEMDNVNNKPVGQNVLARALHGSSYANKTMDEDSKESQTNAYIVGRALSFLRPFGKFAVMDDGKTFEQAVMSSKSWKDLQNHRWPNGMTGKWIDQVTQGLGEYERAEKGLPNGKKIFDIASLKLEEGRIVINQDVMNSIHEMVRSAYKYHVDRDMVPDAVQKNAERFLSDYESFLDDGSPNPAFEIRRPPSEDFIVFTVLTYDAKIDPKTGKFIPDPNLIRQGISAKQQEQMKTRRILTRFPKYYYVNGKRLARWIDDTGTRGNQVREEGFDIIEREVMTRVPGATPGSYRLEPSGQVEKEMVLRLNKGIKLEDTEKGIDNTPKMLLKRLIVEYCLEMLSFPGDTAAHLSKEDWLPLGMFFSPEMRKKFKTGGYGKISERILAETENWIATAFHKEHEWEFFRREDPGIVGDNVFTEKLYREMLKRMGHKLTSHDFMKPISILFSSGGGKSGKH